MKRISAFLLALTVCASLCACGKVKVPSGSEDYIGENWEKVMIDLQEAGFRNIVPRETQVSDPNTSIIDGAVDRISIDDTTEFSPKTKFPEDSEVLIDYSTFKRLPVPLGSESLQETDYKEIADLFEQAGFTNVVSEEIVDLDPDEFSGDYENRVTVDGQKTFSKGDEVPFNSEISIACHLPYDKYDVLLRVDCIANLFFSTYDVDIILDGEALTTLEHGGEAELSLRLKSGEHRLVFANHEKQSVTGETTFNVDGETVASFKLSCHSGSVNIDILYNGPAEDDPARATPTPAPTPKPTPSPTPEPTSKPEEESSSAYDLAYQKNCGEYRLFYLLDLDGQIAKYFASNDEMVLTGTCTGNLKDGLDIYYESEGFHEMLKRKYSGDDSIIILIDANGFDWEFEQTTVAATEAILNRKEDTTEDTVAEAVPVATATPSPKNELPEYQAKRAFEYYGEALFPYGFECHWFSQTYEHSQLTDGSWRFRVGVTITDQYGASYDVTAEALINNTTQSVEDFNITDPLS